MQCLSIKRLTHRRILFAFLCTIGSSKNSQLSPLWSSVYTLNPFSQTSAAGFPGHLHMQGKTQSLIEILCIVLLFVVFSYLARHHMYDEKTFYGLLNVKSQYHFLV